MDTAYTHGERIMYTRNATCSLDIPSFNIIYSRDNDFELAFENGWNEIAMTSSKL